MKLEDYHVLYEMMGEFRREAAKLEVQIDLYNRYIKEAEAHLKTFADEEPDDIKVFSPRKAGMLYKGEKERISAQKFDYEEQNRKLMEKKAVADERIKRLSSVLEHQDHVISSQEEPDKKPLDDIIANLDELVGRIEKSCLQIDRNPIQSRQDFMIIAKCLRETTDEIRNMAE